MFDCFFAGRGSVILLLPPMDMAGVVVRELSTLSDEILGPSETGDLIDSHLGCLPRETLIDLGMHFVRVELPSSLSSIESNCSVLLHSQMIFIVSM